jgi:hypothetical protein
MSVVTKSTFSLAGSSGSLTSSILFNSSNTKQENKQTTEEDVDRYVLLVVAGKMEGTKMFKSWKEFALPLNESRVEAWTGLSNLYFHKITTYDWCKQYDLDFVTFEGHQADDGLYNFF